MISLHSPLHQRAARWLTLKFSRFAGIHYYHGIRLYFPKNSYTLRVLRSQGAFEPDNVRLLQKLTKPDTWLFDVGTNVGIMSVGVLTSVASSHVLSFEPSPNVLSFLQSSMAASPFRERWVLVPKAVGAKVGKTSFSLSAVESSEFDGVRNTYRVRQMKQIDVEMTTVDCEWRKLGSPVVSVLKCDVEGGELDVLRGARDCLEANRPAVLLEWAGQNLNAYGVDPRALVDFAVENTYQLFSVPALVKIQTAEELGLHMIMTENFLLIPCDKSGQPTTHG